MKTMVREAWTDERLDDLTTHVDRGFDRVDRSFDRVEKDFRDLRGEVGDLRGEMNARFERIDDRFDSLHRLMVGSLITFVVGFFAAFGGLLVTHV